MLLELLLLFWRFFKIGLFTFGGGYAMIPLMEQELVGTYIDSQTFLDFIGISESTPGPFAVNISTFIGYEAFGVLGSVIATIAVVLPSFIIILLIASIMSKAINYKGVKYAFLGLSPAAIGLIFGTGGLLIFRAIFMSSNETVNIDFDYKALIISIVIGALLIIFRKKIPPIFIILISAALGLIFYILIP